MVKSYEIKRFYALFLALITLLAVVSAVFFAVDGQRQREKLLQDFDESRTRAQTAVHNDKMHWLYSACDSLKNLDAALGKASVSESKTNMASLLSQVIVHANNVSQSLSGVGFAQCDNLYDCEKFANQTQDYAQYLLKNLCAGQLPDYGQRQGLCNLEEVAEKLRQSMLQCADGCSHNAQNPLAGLEEVQDNAFKYEKLIYDGPYSESVEQKNYAPQKVLSHEQAEREVSKLFGNARFSGEIKEGGWYCFDVDGGRVVTARDGKVAEYERYSEGHAPSAEKCVRLAEEFCRKLGYDVKAVWVSEEGQTVYVNCVTVNDGIKIYPAMVKVAVCDGVVGCEARAYLYNCGAAAEFGNVSRRQAQQTLDKSLVVTKVGKAVVEKDNALHPCYEFTCRKGSRTYFVYVSSVSGEEVDILQVAQGTEGTVL